MIFLEDAMKIDTEINEIPSRQQYYNVILITIYVVIIQ